MSNRSNDRASLCSFTFADGANAACPATTPIPTSVPSTPARNRKSSLASKPANWTAFSFTQGDRGG